MKRCPTCKRTFEDNLTYCLVDGSILSAPFAKDTERDDRATEVLPEGERGIRETNPIAPPPLSTIAARFEPAPRESPKILRPSESKPVALIGIIGLVTILCSLAIVILLLATWKD